MKFLCVCLGNICRSPLAEALLKKHFELMPNLQNWEVDSCGTSNYHEGELADIRTRKNASSYGIEMTHKSRQITLKDCESFDYILVMDHQNYHNVLNLSPENQNKIQLISDLSINFKGQIIPDPYFGDEKGFDEVYKLLDHICAEIAQNIKF